MKLPTVKSMTSHLPILYPDYYIHIFTRQNW